MAERPNSEISAFQTMISGLKTYKASLEEHTEILKVAVQTYDQGINDMSSKVYRKKMEKLCNQINPSIIEEVQKLINNLQGQLEQLERIKEQVVSDDEE